MLSIYDWFGYEMPIQERYRMIRRAGFDGVLMWWSDESGRGDYRNGPMIARKAGLFIENIHTPFANENSLFIDNPDGSARAECLMQCVKDCAEFDIPAMVVHLPDDDNPCTELGLDRIKRITEKAEKLGVNIALENLRNLTNLEYVLGQVESPRVGFCYDCCHHHRNDPNNDLLSKYGNRLMGLHLHDNGGVYDMHSLPFDGTINWRAVMKAIAETGYFGSTALEIMNWGYENLSAEEFVDAAFERAKRLDGLRSGFSKYARTACAIEPDEISKGSLGSYKKQASTETEDIINGEI